MKKNYPNKNVLRLSAIFLTVLALFTIHSCKKNLDQQQLQQQPTDTDIATAKEWYTNAYPVNTQATTNSKLAIQSVNNHRDFSQFMNPDWQHGKKYTRFNRDVIELPLDPASKALFALTNLESKKAFADKRNSRSSFLLLKNGQGYDAYIMTLIADSGYLKGDYSKLDRNTYSKRDTDFSGLVLYFTPKGKFVSGHGYKNGHLIVPAKSSNAQQVQSTGKLKTNTVEDVVCGDWYLNTYINEVLISSEYLYTECWRTSGSGGEGGGGTGAPPQCPPGTTNAFAGLTVNSPVPDAPPGDDGGGGGFPPPNPTQQECAVPIPQAVQEVIDSLTTPCLDNALSAVTAISINNLISTWYNKFAVGNNSTINIKFTEAPDLFSPRNDGTGIIDTVPARTIHTVGTSDYKITINNSYLTYNGFNMAKEAWGQIILHEILHIFTSVNQPAIAAKQQDHLYIFKSLINPSRDLLMSAFGLSAQDATDLALNGLGDLWQYSDFETLCVNAYGRNHSQINTTKYNYFKGSKGVKCH